MILVALLLALADQKATSDQPLIVEHVAASGTIQIATKDAKAKAPSRGTMTVWFRYYVDWHPQDILIVDGKWSAVVPYPCAGVDIGRIVLDGADAYVPAGSWPDDPRSAPINLTATLASTVRLTVLDEASEVPVSEFEVREWGDPWNGYTLPVNGDEGWVVPHSSPGPLSLPAWSLNPDPSFVPGVQWTPKRTFWIRAKGKAWARVNADFAQGGDVVARLRPSSSMRVVIQPEHVARNYLLEIRIDGGTRFMSLDTGVKERVFESLPETNVEVILLDEAHMPAKEVTRRSTTLHAGTETVVCL